MHHYMPVCQTETSTFIIHIIISIDSSTIKQNLLLLMLDGVKCFVNNVFADAV